MLSLSPDQRRLLQAGSQLAYCNPFLPERIAIERGILGAEFIEGETVWSQQVADPEKPRANVLRLTELMEQTMDTVRRQLDSGVAASAQELALYEDTALHTLYLRWWPRFFEANAAAASGKPNPARWRFYSHFLEDWRRFFHIEGVTFPGRARTGAHVRLLPPDLLGVRSGAARHYRRFDAGRAAARRHLAIHLHA